MDGDLAKSPFMGLISVPSDAVLGDTRMRIRLWQSGFENPCGFVEEGDVEDYTITVIDESCSATQYGGGCGTESEPYLISAPEHMQAIGQSPWDWDKYFKLTSDIDLGVYSGSSFERIGYYIPFQLQLPFRGVFDGNNHTISNFTYSASEKSEMGLFGLIRDPNALIKDLTLIDPNLSVNVGSTLGLLVGWLEEGTVSNCHIKGGKISGGSGLGGLIGISGDLNKSGANILNCSSTSTTATSYGAFVGGLVGKNDDTGIISNSFSTGFVSGDMAVGGLVGFGRNSFTNCYSKADVYGVKENIGGFIGVCQSSAITNCYSSGLVEGSDKTAGFIGYRLSTTITDSFYDIETSDQSSPIGAGVLDGVTGKNTNQMQTESTFTNAGWNFEDIWKICEGTNYPKLQWQKSLPGDFTCPDGVDFVDFAVLSEQWLLERLSEDTVPDGGDGSVNFLDWAEFSAGWTSDNNELADFTSQWLGRGMYNADIAPVPNSDGIVNIYDYAMFAQLWMNN